MYIFHIQEIKTCVSFVCFWSVRWSSGWGPICEEYGSGGFVFSMAVWVPCSELLVCPI